MKTKKLLIGLLAGAMLFGFTGTKAHAADGADTTVVATATDETGTIKATATDTTGVEDDTLITSEETATDVDTEVVLSEEEQAAAKAAAAKKAAAKKAAALKAAAIQKEETAEYKKQVKLLTCLILTEAGNQSYKGKVAVANVVLNRVGSGKITAEKIKDVIYAPSQFSVVRNGSFERAMANYDEFDSAQEKECIKAAKAALDNVNYVGNSNYFTRYSRSLANQHPSGMRIEDHYFW